MLSNLILSSHPVNTLNNLLLAGNSAINVFDRIAKGAAQLGTYAKAASWAIFVLAVVIAGIAWVIGGQGANFAKSTLGRVVVGVGIVSLAVAIITTLSDTFGGGSSKPNFHGFKTSAEMLRLFLWSHGIFL